jgi:hypothetical protein
VYHKQKKKANVIVKLRPGKGDTQEKFAAKRLATEDTENTEAGGTRNPKGHGKDKVPGKLFY